jgi:hypothetical protein
VTPTVPHSPDHAGRARVDAAVQPRRTRPVGTRAMADRRPARRAATAAVVRRQRGVSASVRSSGMDAAPCYLDDHREDSPGGRSKRWSMRRPLSAAALRVRPLLIAPSLPVVCVCDRAAAPHYRQAAGCSCWQLASRRWPRRGVSGELTSALEPLDSVERRQGPRRRRLTAMAAVATPTHKPQPSPMTNPRTGCVIHAQISEKESDTGHTQIIGGEAPGPRLPVAPGGTNRTYRRQVAR